MNIRQLLVVVAAAISASAIQAQTPVATGAISGRVVDQSGHPIEGVQLRLSPAGTNAISESDGSFGFFGLHRGVYTVSARRIGYAPASQIVEVRDSTVTTRVSLTAIPRELDSVRIRERSSGIRYTAVVLDQNDQPVAGAEVMAIGVSDTLRTDSLGRFTVGRLGRGTMMLRMRKMGYRAFFDSYRIVTDRSDTLRMSRLSESLATVEIKEQSGFGMDYWVYRDLSQRTRWKTSSAGSISREELAPQGKLNLCDALRRTPSGNHYVFIPPYICPRAYYTMLIDGALCQKRKLMDFTADEVEAVEYFPASSDWSGNLSARCPGTVFVIWMRHDPDRAP